MVTSSIQTIQTEETEPCPRDEIELVEDDSQAPDTDDIEELRRYWDTHAATDYNSEPVPAEEWPVAASTAVYSVRVGREDMHKLADLAEAEGVGSVRMAENLLRRAISEAHRAAGG